MKNKFNIEMLNGYKSRKITSEANFEYEKGFLKIDGIEIAEFNEIEMHIQPILKENPSRNTDCDDKVVTGYEPISVRLNISKKYSRYNEINNYSQLDIEVIDGISISECNIKSIEGNNMILHNVRIENIEMI